MAYGIPHEQYFFVNNWRTVLTAAILSTDTTLPIEGAFVDLLDTPTPASTRRYLATLDDGTNRELVEITGRNTTADTVTVVRGVAGTTAQAFASGATVELRFPAHMVSLLGAGGVDANRNVFIGALNPGGALASGAFRNTFIGSRAGNQLTTGDDNVALGDSAMLWETTGNENVALGVGALENGGPGSADSVAAGYRAGHSPGGAVVRSVLLGAFTDLGTAGLTDVVCLGYGATARANNQVVIGSNNSPITDVYIGEGVWDSTPPAGVTLNATGGNGANVAGAPLRLAGGKGTGTGAGGKLLIATAPAGASGAVQNALVDRAEWDSTGLLWTYGAIQTGDPGGGAGAWKLGTFVAGAVALDTANYVEVEIGGTVRKLLVAA